MKVWVISPGSGVGVRVGVLLGVAEGEGVSVCVLVAVGLGGETSNGMTQALSSEMNNNKINTSAESRFIKVYCTLRKTGKGGHYNDARNWSNLRI
jgi:hypothetical protein